MKDKKIKNFLKPNRRKILILTGLIFIFLVAQPAGYCAFNDFKPPHHEKLCNLFSPLLFVCWSIGIYLFMPLFLLGNITIPFFGENIIVTRPEWLSWLALLPYLYLVSCLIDFTWKKVSLHGLKPVASL